MNNVIKEFLVALSFDVDSSSESQFLNKINSIQTKAVAVGNIIASSIVAIGKSFLNFINQSYDFSKLQSQLLTLAETTGISVKKFNEFGYIAERLGVSFNTAQNLLVSFNKTVNDAYMGTGQGIEAFARLGIRVRDINGNLRTSEDIFQEVTNKLRGLNKEQRLFYMNKLGFDNSLYAYFSQNLSTITDDYNKLNKAIGISESEIAKASSGFFELINTIKTAINKLSQVLFYDFIKKNGNLFVEFKNMLFDNFKKIRDIISNIVSVIVGTFGSAFRLVLNYVKRAINVWNSFSDTAKSVIKVIGGLTLAWKIFSKTLLASPIGLIIGLLLILLALLDDFLVWSEGGESLYDWSYIVDTFRSIYKWFEPIIEKSKDVIKAIKEIGVSLFNLDFQGVLNGFRNLFSSVANLGETIIRQVAKIISNIWDKLWAFFDKDGAYTHIKEKLENIFSVILEGFIQGFKALYQLPLGLIDIIDGLADGFNTDKITQGLKRMGNAITGGWAFKDELNNTGENTLKNTMNTEQANNIMDNIRPFNPLNSDSYFKAEGVPNNISNYNNENNTNNINNSFEIQNIINTSNISQDLLVKNNTNQLENAYSLAIRNNLGGVN